MSKCTVEITEITKETAWSCMDVHLLWLSSYGATAYIVRSMWIRSSTILPEVAGLSALQIIFNSWQWQCNNNSSSKVILYAKIFGSINRKEVNRPWQSSVEHSSFLWKSNRKFSSSLKQARMRTLCWPFCIISYHCEIFHDMMNAQKITSPGQAGKGERKEPKIVKQ